MSICTDREFGESERWCRLPAALRRSHCLPRLPSGLVFIDDPPSTIIIFYRHLPHFHHTRLQLLFLRQFPQFPFPTPTPAKTGFPPPQLRTTLLPLHVQLDFLSGACDGGSFLGQVYMASAFPVILIAAIWGLFLRRLGFDVIFIEKK